MKKSEFVFVKPGENKRKNNWGLYTYKPEYGAKLKGNIVISDYFNELREQHSGLFAVYAYINKDSYGNVYINIDEYKTRKFYAYDALVSENNWTAAKKLCLHPRGHGKDALTAYSLWNEAVEAAQEGKKPQKWLINAIEKTGYLDKYQSDIEVLEKVIDRNFVSVPVHDPEKLLFDVQKNIILSPIRPAENPGDSTWLYYDDNLFQYQLSKGQWYICKIERSAEEYKRSVLVPELFYKNEEDEELRRKTEKTVREFVLEHGSLGVASQYDWNVRNEYGLAAYSDALKYVVKLSDVMAGDSYYVLRHTEEVERQFNKLFLVDSRVHANHAEIKKGTMGVEFIKSGAIA